MNRGKFILALAVVTVFLFPGFSAADYRYAVEVGMGAAFPNQGGDILDDINPGAGFMINSAMGLIINRHYSAFLDLGFSTGSTDDYIGDPTTYQQTRIVLAGRYSRFVGDNWQPYIQAGVGAYSYGLQGDDNVFNSDFAPGYEVYLGANYYLGGVKYPSRDWRFRPRVTRQFVYVGVMAGYHFVNYSDGELDLDPGPTESMDFDASGNEAVIMVTLGMAYYYENITEEEFQNYGRDKEEEEKAAETEPENKTGQDSEPEAENPENDDQTP